MPAPRSPEASLGLRLGLGALLLVAAAWLFGAVAEDVANAEHLTVLDVQFAEWLRRHATPQVTEWMRVVTNLHSTIAVSAYAGLAAIVLLRRHAWRTLALLGACVGGGLTVNVLMKLAFHRARPVLDDPLLKLSSYSFPSGHVAASTILYGLLVVWVFSRTRSTAARAAAVAGAVLAIALVAFTRMYLGVHFFSDVVAAFAEGVAWLAICLTGFAAFWRRSGIAPAAVGAETGATPGPAR
jgi:membrane-associated phospholipid phosphatase